MTVGQRVLSEPTRLGAEVEASLAVVNDAREIFHTLSALMESHVLSPGLSSHLRELGMELANFLDELASRVPPDQELPRPPNVTNWKNRLQQERVHGHADSSTDSAPDAARREWLITQFEALIDAIQALYSAVCRLHSDEEISHQGTPPGKREAGQSTATARGRGEVGNR